MKGLLRCMLTACQPLRCVSTQHQSFSASHSVKSDWHTRLKKAVSPLADLPYDYQLQLKHLRCVALLQRLGLRLAEIEAELGRHDTLDLISSSGGTFCQVEPTKPSPVTDGYRNKSSFSIGIGPDGDPKTVGYFTGDWRKRNIVCVPPTWLQNDKEEHKCVAEAYQTFIRRSPLPLLLDFQDGGYWRSITVRSNRADDLMAIVTFHPQAMSKIEGQEVREALRSFFVEGEGRMCGLKSLYFQESTKTRTDNEESPFELLLGSPHIYETIQGHRFQISPSSFFQVNTLATEVLYSTVLRDVSQADRETTLVDLCCGTGTIGILMAPSVKEVIGIEVVQQAVRDAEVNARINDIRNIRFVCGAAERVLPGVIAELDSDSHMTVVANPARAGLHSKVIGAIRRTPAIRRVVYVSCKPDGSAFDNFVSLCKPEEERVKGRPFVPVRAVPVDLFPHTSHCELVMLFQR